MIFIQDTAVSVNKEFANIIKYDTSMFDSACLHPVDKKMITTTYNMNLIIAITAFGKIILVKYFNESDESFY